MKPQSSISPPQSNSHTTKKLFGGGSSVRSATSIADGLLNDSDGRYCVLELEELGKAFSRYRDFTLRASYAS